jgi:hypothetical protein
MKSNPNGELGHPTANMATLWGQQCTITGVKTFAVWAGASSMNAMYIKSMYLLFVRVIDLASFLANCVFVPFFSPFFLSSFLFQN